MGRERPITNSNSIAASWLFCNSMGFIPLRFIVAPLLPRLSLPVDGEIRAKNFQGEREKARQTAGLFFMQKQRQPFDSPLIEIEREAGARRDNNYEILMALPP